MWFKLRHFPAAAGIILFTPLILHLYVFAYLDFKCRGSRFQIWNLSWEARKQKPHYLDFKLRGSGPQNKNWNLKTCRVYELCFTSLFFYELQPVGQHHLVELYPRQGVVLFCICFEPHHIYIYIYIHMHIHICMYTHVYIYIYTHIYMQHYFTIQHII